METATIQQYPFLAGGGEMGEHTRQYDWSTTSLGSPDQWPQSLRATLSIILNVRFPMFLWWGPELIQFYNDAYRPSLGNDGKHPTALGQKGADCWPEIWPVVKPLIDGVLAGGEATWSEDQLIPIYRNGQMEDVYWTFSYSSVKDESGQVAGVLVTCTETTKAVVARRKLEEEQRELLNSFEQSPVAIATVSAENLTFRMANAFYGHLVGRRPDQIVDKPLLEALPELAGQGFDELLNNVIATGTPFTANEVAVDILRNNRLETMYVDMTYQPQYDADKSVSGVLVVAIDVTQQVVSRKAIEESEARFRSLIEEAPVATALFVGPELIIDVANELMIRFFGKGPSIIGKPVRDVLTAPGTDESAMALLDQVLNTGEVFTATAAPANLTIDGVPGTYYFDLSLKPLRNAAGAVYAVLETAINVTAQVMARQKLEEAESDLRVAVEMAQLGTWNIDVATNGLTYSERLIEWFGYNPAEQNYRQVIPILEANDQERVATAVAWALNPQSGGVYNEIYTVIHPQTGNKRILHAQGKTVFDATGKAVRLNGTAQDITMQRELQLALEQEVQQRTEELEATNQKLTVINEEIIESNHLLARSNDNLQKFAYVASHDLQEPLRKIQQFGDLLKDQYAEPLGDGVDFLERMQSAASRMSTLIRDLLNFSRISTQRDTNALVPLGEVVSTVLTDLDLRIQETGAVIEVGPLPTIAGDVSQLRQLVQNLLSNALKFRRTDVPPVITISSRLVAAADLPPAVKPIQTAVAYHCIDVADNGIGFDDKYADRIFEVFQRLHSRSEFVGTGIGLAIVQKVVENHGGAVGVASRPARELHSVFTFPRQVRA